MNTLDRLRARLTVGTVMECVENTYIPDRAGGTITFTRVGKSTAEATWSQREGVYGVSLPVRVRDVTWLDAERPPQAGAPTGRPHRHLPIPRVRVMSASVRPCHHGGGLCFKNQRQARGGLDTYRQRHLADGVPVELLPTDVYRHDCGRWHLGSVEDRQRRHAAIRALQTGKKTARLTSAA
jgi:hypothetical protein